MFSAIFNRAQATVDNAIGQVVNRALIAVPFLIAGGFATASAYIRLDRELGAEMATLAMAGGFAVFGIIATAIFGRRGTAPVSDAAPSLAGEAVSSEADAAPSALSETDKDLIYAALTSAVPLALPGLIRLVMRNLPIIAAILAAIFVITRTPKPQAEGDQPVPA